MSKTIDKLRDIVAKFGVGAPLATTEQIMEKFDEKTANAIIEDRRIIFWHYGLPFGAMFGALVMLIAGLILSLV